MADQLTRRVPGGIGTMIRGLLQGIDSVEPRPSVSLYASRAPRGGDPVDALASDAVRSHLPGWLMTRAWERGWSGVPRDFDVVHATSLAFPPPRQRSLVVTVHDLSWRQVPEAFPTRGRRWHERALERLRVTDAKVVVPSPAVAKDVEEQGIEAVRIAVIPHGSDHLPPADHPKADLVLTRLGVEGDYILTVGTLEPRKNMKTLFDAYTRARPRLPAPWPLVVIGPSGWGESVRQVEGVRLLGSTDPPTLAALYERARLVAYVPLVEGFGFPPLEAMRHRAPVVSSAVPSVDGASLEVDPLDAEAIADALVKVGSDEVLRSRLVAAGLARSASLTWHSAAEAYVELWSSLR